MTAGRPATHAPLARAARGPLWFRLLPAWIALCVIVADRVTKWAIEHSLSPLDTVVVIPGFFHLVRTENRGAAFGLFADLASPWREAVLVGLSLVALGVVVKILWGLRPAEGGALTMLSLSLILGGALGNLYDRIRFGAVLDFLLLFVGDFHWPAFNVADTSITVGAALLLVDLWRGRNRSTQKVSPTTA